MSTARGIDHVAVVAADLEEAAAAWTRLGFALTPLSPHTQPGLDGAPIPTGTGNRCAMLRAGYIELLATIDPGRPSATIQRFLAHHPGIHVVSLAVDDAEAALARLARAGFETAIARSERPTADGPARFARIPLPDQDPRLQLIQQLTPELVWREAELHHPNHAIALDAVVFAADVPAELAARLSRAAGRPVMPDPLGGFVLALPEGRLRVLPPEAVAALFPGFAPPRPPCVAGIVLRTDDANAAVSALDVARPTPHGRLAVAGGVAVLFNP